MQTSDSTRQAWVDFVMNLRKHTCAKKEHEVKLHIQETLKFQKRASRFHLKFVVYGMEVCKGVFAWAHGFAESTFNRAHAIFNGEYQRTNPIEVLSMQHSVCVFPVWSCFVVAKAGMILFWLV